MIRAPWNERFLRSAEAFPRGSHDDDIDAASLGIIELGVRPEIPGALGKMPVIPHRHDAPIQLTRPRILRRHE
jgi:hypothetical protein